MTIRELVAKSVNMRFEDVIQFNKGNKIIDHANVFNIIFDDMMISNEKVERFQINIITGYHIIWIE